MPAISIRRTRKSNGKKKRNRRRNRRIVAACAKQRWKWNWWKSKCNEETLMLNARPDRDEVRFTANNDDTRQSVCSAVQLLHICAWLMQRIAWLCLDYHFQVNYCNYFICCILHLQLFFALPRRKQKNAPNMILWNVCTVTGTVIVELLALHCLALVWPMR